MQKQSIQQEQNPLPASDGWAGRARVKPRRGTSRPITGLRGRGQSGAVAHIAPEPRLEQAISVSSIYLWW